MNDDTNQDATARLRELGERYFTTQHTYDPYNATLLGLSEFDHLPGDPSSEASERAADEFASIGREVAAVDAARLSEKDRVDRDVLTVLVRGAQGDAEHSLWAGNASAKSYVSRQALIFQAMPAMTITDDASAERYLERLSGVARVLTAVGDRYADEAARGRFPTAIGIAHSVRQLEGYLALGVDGDVLLTATRTPAGAPYAERAESILSLIHI